VSTAPAREEHNAPPPGVLAAAEQGYHGFLDVSTQLTAQARLLIAYLGPLGAFACLTAQLKRADPDVRAGLAAIALIRAAQHADHIQERTPPPPPPSTIS